MESSFAYRGDTIWNCDRGQAATVSKSPITYRSHRVGDGDGSQVCAAVKSRITDDGDITGNNSITASTNESVIRRFNDGIAVVSTVINGIAGVYDD